MTRRALSVLGVLVVIEAFLVSACSYGGSESQSPVVTSIPSASESGDTSTGIPSFAPGQSADPSPAAPDASATKPPACMTSQLEITTTNSAVAAGTVGGYLRFLNSSSQACTLHGWPAVIGVTGTGMLTVARDVAAALTFPRVSDPPTVSLNPGDDAFAAYAGGDNPGQPLGSCPSYHTLRVTPPEGATQVTLSAFNPYFGHDLPACAGLETTMIVPAVDLTLLQPLRP